MTVGGLKSKSEEVLIAFLITITFFLTSMQVILVPYFSNDILTVSIGR